MNRKIVASGVDCYSYNLKTASALKAAGAEFIFGYLAPKGYTKRMTLDRVKALTDLGLLSVNVYETVGDRAKGGAVNGKYDGQQAAENACEIQMPDYGCIYMAIDYGLAKTQYNTAEEYLLAAREQIKPHHLFGAYGPHALLDYLAGRGVCDLYWQAYAWNRPGGVSPHAVMHQCSAELTIAGVNVDRDNAYTLGGLWNLSSDETNLLVKSVKTKVRLASPDYWEKVIKGTKPLDPAYLKGLFKLVCTAGGKACTDETLYDVADGILNLNSDAYWQAVLTGTKTASVANVKALFERIDTTI